MKNNLLQTVHQNYTQLSTRENAYTEVFWIMAHCLNITWPDLHLRYVSDFPDEVIQSLYKSLEQYLSGRPVAYITGVAPFMDLILYVEEGVLIPRPDTECLVKCAQGILTPGQSVLELGVGSGAISIALAKMIGHITVTGIERSAKAVEVARKNIHRYGLEDRITLIQKSWYESLDLPMFDLLITNPPYIAEGDKDLSLDVQLYEPKEALISESNGLADIEYIIKNAPLVVKSGGSVLIEHGYKQQDSVVALLIQYGYKSILRGYDRDNPRFVKAVV